MLSPPNLFVKYYMFKFQFAANSKISMQLVMVTTSEKNKCIIESDRKVFAVFWNIGGKQ